MYKTKIDGHGNILLQYRSSELNPVHNTTIDGFLWLESLTILEHKTNYWDGEAWATRSVPPTKYSVWEGEWVHSQGTMDILIGHTAIKIRSLRDNFLSQSDWTQIADSPLSKQKQQEWATYRQTLRDFPPTQVGVVDLDAIEWPTKPI